MFVNIKFMVLMGQLGLINTFFIKKISRTSNLYKIQSSAFYFYLMNFISITFYINEAIIIATINEMKDVTLTVIN